MTVYNKQYRHSSQDVDPILSTVDRIIHGGSFLYFLVIIITDFSSYVNIIKELKLPLRLMETEGGWEKLIFRTEWGELTKHRRWTLDTERRRRSSWSYRFGRLQKSVETLGAVLRVKCKLNAGTYFIVTWSCRRRVYHPQLVAVYHHCVALYIIIAKEDTAYGWWYTPNGDDIHDYVVMICHCFRNG